MMNERQKLQHLFMFDLWCTRKLTSLIMSNSPFPQETASLAFLSHIINAQKIWFNRVVLLTEKADPDIWEEYETNEIKQEAKNSVQSWLDLIGDHEVDLNSTIYYTNSQGVSFNNTLWQICNHLIIHGQHHRAQISLFLRNSDINPPAIDYIHFARSEFSNKNFN